MKALGSPIDPQIRKPRLLVVDDEPSLRRVVARFFAKEYEVTQEPSSKNALARIVGGEAFDVILCDLMMPEMTGMRLYEELCAKVPAQAARMVFMTGTSFERVTRKFLDGITGRWIDKPFDRAELSELVRKVASAG